MNLVLTMEALMKRKLTADEVGQLADFQSMFKVQDDDPLLVVLAMMARAQIITETIPNLLQQKALETIELHRTVMREQSVLMSKELIDTIAKNIRSASLELKSEKLSWRSSWVRYSVCFIGGMILAAAIFRLGH